MGLYPECVHKSYISMIKDNANFKMAKDLKRPFLQKASQIGRAHV